MKKFLRMLGMGDRKPLNLRECLKSEFEVAPRPDAGFRKLVRPNIEVQLVRLDYPNVGSYKD